MKKWSMLSFLMSLLLLLSACAYTGNHADDSIIKVDESLEENQVMNVELTNGCVDSGNDKIALVEIRAINSSEIVETYSYSDMYLYSSEKSNYEFNVIDTYSGEICSELFTMGPQFYKSSGDVMMHSTGIEPLDAGVYVIEAIFIEGESFITRMRVVNDYDTSIEFLNQVESVKNDISEFYNTFESTDLPIID